MPYHPVYPEWIRLEWQEHQPRSDCWTCSGCFAYCESGCFVVASPQKGECDGLSARANRTHFGNGLGHCDFG
jgi:hypothetical protein